MPKAGCALQGGLQAQGLNSEVPKVTRGRWLCQQERMTATTPAGAFQLRDHVPGTDSARTMRDYSCSGRASCKRLIFRS